MQKIGQANRSFRCLGKVASKRPLRQGAGWTRSLSPVECVGPLVRMLR